MAGQFHAASRLKVRLVSVLLEVYMRNTLSKLCKDTDDVAHAVKFLIPQKFKANEAKGAY